MVNETCTVSERTYRSARYFQESSGPKLSLTARHFQVESLELSDSRTIKSIETIITNPNAGPARRKLDITSSGGVWSSPGSRRLKAKFCLLRALKRSRYLNLGARHRFWVRYRSFLSDSRAIKSIKTIITNSNTGPARRKFDIKSWRGVWTVWDLVRRLGGWISLIGLTVGFGGFFVYFGGFWYILEDFEAKIIRNACWTAQDARKTL